jgi:hypothetical protein
VIRGKAVIDQPLVIADSPTTLARLWPRRRTDRLERDFN